MLSKTLHDITVWTHACQGVGGEELSYFLCMNGASSLAHVQNCSSYILLSAAQYVRHRVTIYSTCLKDRKQGITFHLTADKLMSIPTQCKDVFFPSQP